MTAIYFSEKNFQQKIENFSISRPPCVTREKRKQLPLCLAVFSFYVAWKQKEKY